MVLARYKRALRRYWVTAALALGLIFLTAACYAFFSPKSYSSNIQLYVSAASPSDTTSSAYQGSLLSSQQAKSFAQLIDTDTVGDAVAARLGLQETGAQLMSRVTASSQPDSVIITISSVGPSPAEAAAISNEVAGVGVGLVNRLAQQAVGPARANVVAQVVSPAVIPAAPSAPRVRLVLAVGAVLGLAGAFGSALARDVLATRVRSREDVEELSHTPVLGEIPRGVDSLQISTSQTESGSRINEQVRKLRTNLSYATIDTDAPVIQVTSPMPADGKTTTACLLAFAVAAGGASVLLLDADLRKPSISRQLGLPEEGGLSSVLTGRLTFRQALQNVGMPNLQVIVCGEIPPNPSELLGSQAMAALMEQAKSSFDIVILDCPPTLPVSDALDIASRSDGVLMVCRGGRTKKRELVAALDAYNSLGKRVSGIVLNDVTISSSAATGYYRQYGANADSLVASKSAVAGVTRSSGARDHSQRSDETIELGRSGTDTSRQVQGMEAGRRPRPGPRPDGRS